MAASVAPLDRSELAARIGLLATPGLKPNRVLQLLLEHGSGAEVYRALPDACGAALASAARSDQVRARVRRALAAVADLGLHVIPHGDPRYPSVVAARLDAFAPPLLFARGRLELLATQPVGAGVGVGVVGSRRASSYGLDVAAEIGGGVARAGGCVVSGVALGIDAAAHAAALDAGGASIGVLGCGVDVYYPRQNTRLQDRLARDGVLISELLPGEPPRKHNFPERNRIIAALCNTVVVVEAAAKSGALTTAGHAAANGEVLCVMNDMHLPNMQGILTLLREGAKPYTGVRDLLAHVQLIGLADELPWSENAGEETPPAAPLHARVWAATGTRPRPVDRIAGEAGLPVSRVLGALLELELDGRVRQVDGTGFVRVRPAQKHTPGRAALAHGHAHGQTGSAFIGN